MGELYELVDFNPIGVNNNKRQIILTDTKRNYVDYINSLRYRYNKKNPYLPNYVISKTGDLYSIIEPSGYSKFMEDQDIDKFSIIISLENLGWFKKNALEETYVTWLGDIYKKKVFEKKWRDQLYWDIYTDEQMGCLSNLIIKLCNDFKINKECIGTNVIFDNVKNFKGIVSKSNFDFIHKDVNPSFDFKRLKKLIGDD